jgi:hypothetical protein
MSTQEKTAAIKSILLNHQDNVSAKQNAQVPPGLDPYVIEAMNDALKSDLQAVFAFKPTPQGRD